MAAIALEAYTARRMFRETGTAIRSLFSLVLALCAASGAQAAEEVRFWHALQGTAGEQVAQLASRFNASQKQFRVVPEYKGGREETLAAAMAARRSAAAPHLVHVYEAGIADVMAHKDTVRPLWQVMAEAGQPLEGNYVPAVLAHFADARGNLLALPLDAATPVLYYNRDAFRSAKLDPERPPRTWYEMPAAIAALLEAGSACGLTTTQPAWVLLENMSAWHNQEFASPHNGMSGGRVRLAINGHLMMRWVSMLSSWLKSGYFTYAGRGDEAEEKFASGECALLTASSARYGALRERAGFDFAVAQLPYYDDVPRAPQNTLLDGGAIWVMAGKPKAQYRGAVRFLAYLARPEVQAEWHQKTGYVPLTTAAFELTRQHGFYRSHPGHEIAVRQLLGRQPARDMKAIRLGNFREIRAVLDEELEAVWNGTKTPFEALNTATARGNKVLERSSTRRLAGG
jgi:sn-glycerol 3-phosphate transport system substrate-binding protein